MQAVIVDVGRFGKPIAKSHAHVVAGMGLDHRPRDLPVIAEEISCPAGDAHPAMPGFKIDVHHWRGRGKFAERERQAEADLQESAAITAGHLVHRFHTYFLIFLKSNSRSNREDRRARQWASVRREGGSFHSSAAHKNPSHPTFEGSSSWGTSS